MSRVSSLKRPDFDMEQEIYDEDTTHDAAIIQTAQDALEAKHAAVQAGYYKDAYIRAFLTHPTRRHVQPLIKRGTYARVCCMDRAVKSFGRQLLCLRNEQQQQKQQPKLMNNHVDGQVIVLGAGLDTSYFRWMETARNKNNSEEDKIMLQWFELDHAVVCQEKATVVETHEIFTDQFQVLNSNNNPPGIYQIQPRSNNSNSKNSAAAWWCTCTCTLISHDLRVVSGFMEKLVQQAGLNPSLPTLILCECVQMYLPITQSKALLTILVTALSSSNNSNDNNRNDVVLCSYEPILGNDSHFGRVMQGNLQRAGLAAPTSGLMQHRTLSQHLDFYAQVGLVRGVACSLYIAYHTVLTAEQRRHANQAEFLDELEEWTLIMQHYALCLATTASSKIGKRLVVVVDKDEKHSRPEWSTPLLSAPPTSMNFPKAGSVFRCETEA